MTKATFDHFYIKNRTNFLQFLQKRFSDAQVQDCEEVIANSYFAILKKVEQNTPIDNLEAYCKTAIRNRYMRKQKAKKNLIHQDKIEYSVSDYGSVAYDDSKWQAYDYAFAKVGEKCQAAFKSIYTKNEKLKDVWQDFGYKTYEGFRKAFSRCKNKFKTHYETYFQQNV